MNKKEQRRESHAGFHFYNLYQNCPRKFYIAKILRIVPKKQSSALMFGSAFHEGKATFYKTKSAKRAVSKLLKELEETKNLYEDIDVYEDHVFKGPILLTEWIKEFGQDDLENFEFLSVEEEMIVDLGSFYLTVRPDAVVRNKADNNVYIMETKTTHFSEKLTKINVKTGDQATAYLLAVTNRWPEHKVLGVWPDIAYWNAKSKRNENIILDRSLLVTRTRRDLREYQVSTAALISQISQRVQELPNYEPIVLFPRNTSWCSMFFRECEYEPICRNVDLTEKGRAPMGFRRDRLTKNHIIKELS